MAEQYEDIDETEARLRRNLESIVADLLVVFRTDLADFVGKEVRNQFVTHADFAETLSNDQVLAIKKRCDEVGAQVAEEVVAGLSGDMDFWFGPEVPAGEGKTLDAHTGLMERLQAAAEATVGILREFGFPEDKAGVQPVRYHPPAYFVNGKYAPGLAESFWKYLGQLNEVREARREQDEGRRRAVQRHRWDTIEQPSKK
jgi:hypothetical protein